jgi:mRNA interferase HigB
MHVISYRKIREFIEAHPSAKAALNSWYKVTKKVQWNNLAEVKQTYPSADLVGQVIVFNIGGNNYRLIAGISYRIKTIYIKGVYTHAEYDKDDWKT